MARTPSTMVALGTPAPGFSLQDAEGRSVSDTDYADAPALLIVFWCNHCPFVKHVRDSFLAFANEYEPRGLAVVAINSNADVVADDSPQAMLEEIERYGYDFPYLVDGDQSAARAHRAACTPDFFLYDHARELVYRGQYDASRPGLDTPVTGHDLRAATEAVLAGEEVSREQRPSIGCNIKWKPEATPSWFGA